MDRLEAMRVFVRVVELESFTAVARERGVTQPTVSKCLAGLEEELGTTLVDRTTRTQSVTEAGRIYYDHCCRILEAVRDAAAHVQRLGAAIVGRLRVQVPALFGRLHIVPGLPDFLRAHPDLRVDVTLDDARVDLLRAGVDLAIRIGELADSTMMAQRVGTTRRVTVAAPAYFDAHGRPERPEDLLDHDCLVFTPLSTGSTWHFLRGDEDLAVKVDGCFSANDGQALRRVALAGLGVTVLPTWLVGDELASGRLEVVLPEHEPPRLPISVIYPPARHVPPKTRAFIELVRDRLAAVPEVQPEGGRPLR